MSPKSRGRRNSGRTKRQHRPDRPVRHLRLSDRLMRAADEITGDERNVFDVEFWASGWFGQAWLDAGIAEREPEKHLCMEVVGRACSHPSASGLAAVAALRRIAPPSERPMLDETIAILSEDQPSPPWIDAPEPRAVAAWRAVDVWDSERVLFVDYHDTPQPHTLLAAVNTVGGLMVEKLGLLDVGAAGAWQRLRDADEVPMPLSPASVEDVLTELADALRATDMTWPRQDDEDFVDLRALAWSRCRSHLPSLPSIEEAAAAEDADAAARPPLVEDFVHLPVLSTFDQDVVRSLADLFLDYGQGYIHSGALAWSPAHVGLFLTDWLPRKAILDADQRAALPATLRAWLRFTLSRRGVEGQWIAPVVAAVEDNLPGFTAAFDDEASWGPAKHLAAELTALGIDLTDREAVEQAVQAVNAGNLARTLLELPPE